MFLGLLEIYVLGSIAQVFFVIASYSYALIKVKLLRKTFVINLNNEESIKVKKYQIARKTDMICFLISLLMNLIYLVAIVVISIF